MMMHQQQQQQEEQEAKNGGTVGFVKVMTDEQMEILRKQIAAYATICEQLVDMHKSLTSNPHHLSGAGLGNLYCDPLVTNIGFGSKMGRQRWTPTPVQLQILERIFDQGNGTPSKQKIKEITSELSQHGQILETNVYNWFQNRRARSKRKQQVTNPNNGESEVETEVESSNEKKTKSEDFQSQLNQCPRAEDMCFQTPEISSGMHLNGSGKPSRSSGQMSFYDSMASTPRIDHLVGKMEDSGSYNPYMQADDFDLS